MFDFFAILSYEIESIGIATESENKFMSVQEIEVAITQLPADELIQLVTWLAKYQEKVWDKQIEYDLEAGRLDALLAEIDEEYEAGLAQPL